MFDYCKSKQNALALRNCLITLCYTDWVDGPNFTFPEEVTDRFHFLDFIRLAEQESSIVLNLASYFKLFNLDIAYSKLAVSKEYFKHLANLSRPLGTYLSKFDLLLGISFDFIGYGQSSYSFPFINYQMLIQFLLPFGNIGLVPVKSSLYENEPHIIIAVPESHIHEYENFPPEQLVISGSSLIELITYSNAEREYLDYELLFKYWFSEPQCTFTEYFKKHLAQYHQVKPN